MNAEAPDFKATLNLPVTSFPMRANLPAREPEILAQPQRLDGEGPVAGFILSSRASGRTFRFRTW